MVIKFLPLSLDDIPMLEAKIAQMRANGYQILLSHIHNGELVLVLEKPDQANAPARPPALPEKSASIIEMVSGRTKGSGSPMWRCLCEDGTRVNVFKHSDPEKNNFARFEAAGYAPEMVNLKDGERVAWSKHPIRVKLTKSGDFWDVVSVDARPADAKPDAKPLDEIPF